MSDRLPLRHISVRIPWHDNGWVGSVCSNLKANAACLALRDIRENKDDESDNATSHTTRSSNKRRTDLPSSSRTRTAYS